MSPSSGKASGKTITLTAYLDWFEDATGINDSDPKEWHELRERIAELEAELASERTLAETAWRANADLVAANEKAGAKVERLTNVCEAYRRFIEGGGRESKSLSARKATRKIGPSQRNDAGYEWEVRRGNTIP